MGAQPSADENVSGNECVEYQVVFLCTVDCDLGTLEGNDTFRFGTVLHVYESEMKCL